MWKALLVVTLATGLGTCLEVGQLFQPSRVASVGDAASNAAGAALSLAWYALEGRLRFISVGG